MLDEIVTLLAAKRRCDVLRLPALKLHLHLQQIMRRRIILVRARHAPNVRFQHFILFLQLLLQLVLHDLIVLHYITILNYTNNKVNKYGYTSHHRGVPQK